MTASIIDHYESRLRDEEAKGPDPSRVLVTLRDTLDTRTNYVRVRETSGGNMVADAMFDYFKDEAGMCISSHHQDHVLRNGRVCFLCGVFHADSYHSHSLVTNLPIYAHVLSLCVSPSLCSCYPPPPPPPCIPFLDAAIINGGFLRGDTTYPPGHELTLKDLRGELPFPKICTLLRIKGSDFRSAVEQQLVQAPKPSGAFPHFSKGSGVVFNPSLEPGKRVRRLYINEEDVEDDQEYTVSRNTIRNDNDHDVRSSFLILLV